MTIFKWLFAGTVLLISVLLFSACSSASKVARFTIEGKDNLTFTPDTITVKAGQEVDLTLVNHGSLPHTFSVPDLSIEVQMPPGATNQITFTAPTAGEYPFSSGLIEEFDKMKGKIIVK